MFHGCGCSPLILGTLAIAAVVCFFLIPHRPGWLNKRGAPQENNPRPAPRADRPANRDRDGQVATDDKSAGEKHADGQIADGPRVGANNPDAENAAADEELRLAELLIENDRINPARRRLRGLIEKYPDTAAAAKAKKRLNSLPAD
jgi:hypothetical protein